MTAPDRPLVVVLGGPNGAGKSTCAAALLPDDLPFINADEVAKGLPEDIQAHRDIEAGRIVLARMDELEAGSRSFAVETTLAGRPLATRIGRLKQRGYLFRLVYIWSPSPDFSVERVASRARLGGTTSRREPSGGGTKAAGGTSWGSICPWPIPGAPTIIPAGRARASSPKAKRVARPSFTTRPSGTGFARAPTDE